MTHIKPDSPAIGHCSYCGGEVDKLPEGSTVLLGGPGFIASVHRECEWAYRQRRPEAKRFGMVEPE